MGSKSAIVLAGGRSRRFGRDKASADLLGLPLLQRVLDRLAGLVDDCVLVVRAEQQLPALRASRFRVAEDLFPNAGPLGGLYTGLKVVAADHALTVACDMPFLEPGLLAELVRLGEHYAAVIPVYDGLPQPLCASYSKACLPVLLRYLEAGVYQLRDAVDALSPCYLEPEVWRRLDPDALSFLNINRQEDLEHAVSLLSPAGGR